MAADAPIPDGLAFRTWRSSDVDDLVAGANNRRVWMNLKDRFPHPYTAQDAEDWIGMNHLMMGPATNFAIDLHGKVIGGVGVEGLEDVFHNTMAVGYWVAEPYWGRGIATAAVTFIAGYAFEMFDVQRLEARVADWNPAAARVLEKSGFTFEGRLARAVTKEDRVGDLLVYARVRAAAARG